MEKDEQLPPYSTSPGPPEWLRLVVPWLQRRDLVTACRVNRGWFQAAAPVLWRCPSQHFIHDSDMPPLERMQRFLVSLACATEATRRLVVALELQDLDARVVDGLSETWLRDILKGLPSLDYLNIGNSALVTANAISLASDAEYANVRTLRIAHLHGLSQKHVTELVRMLPRLQIFDASAALDVGDTTLAALSGPPFTILVRGCSGVTDAGLFNVLSRLDASQRQIELDIGYTHCTEATGDTLWQLPPSQRARIARLGVAGTPLFREHASELIKALPSLKGLDVGDGAVCDWRVLQNGLRGLQYLRIDTQAVLTGGPISLSQGAEQLELLVLCRVPFHMPEATARRLASLIFSPWSRLGSVLMQMIDIEHQDGDENDLAVALAAFSGAAAHSPSSPSDTNVDTLDVLRREKRPGAPRVRILRTLGSEQACVHDEQDWLMDWTSI